MNIKKHIWVAGWVGFKLNPFQRTAKHQWSDLELKTSFQFKSFFCQIPSHQSFKLCKNDHFYFNACLNQTFELDKKTTKLKHKSLTRCTNIRSKYKALSSFVSNINTCIVGSRGLVTARRSCTGLVTVGPAKV